MKKRRKREQRNSTDQPEVFDPCAKKNAHLGALEHRDR
jgi:hypothetical protein